MGKLRDLERRGLIESFLDANGSVGWKSNVPGKRTYEIDIEPIRTALDS
jgi:hypothetical protein